MVDEGLIDIDEALRRVTGAQLAQLMFPRFDDDGGAQLLATGMNASPGAAVGKAVFDSATAVEWAERGEDVILVRKETNPDDLHGMVAASGILTSRGGKTSHAAVVARGMGRTCVCGAEALDVDASDEAGHGPRRRPCSEGDVISIDGTTGEVFAGRRAGRRLPRSCATSRASDVDERDLVRRGRRMLMAHADERRRLRVRANADTAEDAARARRFGAEGIGLCRTEHMFLGERRQLVENLIVAEDEDGQEAALAALLPLQRAGLRRDPRGDGRAAGDDPADRPAAARVPARPHRAVGRRWRWRRSAATPTSATPRAARRRSAACTSRTRCSACAASASAS